MSGEKLTPEDVQTNLDNCKRRLSDKMEAQNEELKTTNEELEILTDEVKEVKEELRDTNEKVCKIENDIEELLFIFRTAKSTIVFSGWIGIAIRRIVVYGGSLFIVYGALKGWWADLLHWWKHFR